ncbi:hypothetical protein [Hwangdonia lutea]|uniref:DUF922 domain-containing protein n=1 Tax=Hwangdonia lutea TaxID=3075823 RepID=A0AA97HS11_9FLAO|nr:hypothetical protein [Hwangdonia sp. SCSIO 19198]WOD45257.1 hypothetical protein RNZ46_08275 [Hwangdonia sp. SCSIO 19198]
MILVSFCNNLIAQKPLAVNEALLLWNHNKKIEWSDFRGKVPNDKGLKLAVTSSEISIKASFYKGEIPVYIVKSYFNKNESWTSTKSIKHLIHERLHFDITELFSRRIRHKLDLLMKEGVKDVNVYKKAYRKLLDDYSNEQNKYDSEVYFNNEKQHEWIKNVHKELEELKEYKYSS